MDQFDARSFALRNLQLSIDLLDIPPQKYLDCTQEPPLYPDRSHKRIENPRDCCANPVGIVAWQEACRLDHPTLPSPFKYLRGKRMGERQAKTAEHLVVVPCSPLFLIWPGGLYLILSLTYGLVGTYQCRFDFERFSAKATVKAKVEGTMFDEGTFGRCLSEFR